MSIIYEALKKVQTRMLPQAADEQAQPIVVNIQPESLQPSAMDQAPEESRSLFRFVMPFAVVIFTGVIWLAGTIVYYSDPIQQWLNTAQPAPAVYLQRESPAAALPVAPAAPLPVTEQAQPVEKPSAPMPVEAVEAPDVEQPQPVEQQPQAAAPVPVEPVEASIADQPAAASAAEPAQAQISEQPAVDAAAVTPAAEPVQAETIQLAAEEPVEAAVTASQTAEEPTPQAAVTASQPAPAAPQAAPAAAAPSIPTVTTPFHVQGIMTQNGQSVVLVNDRIYEQGDMVGAIKLLSITPDAITILRNGNEERILMRH